MFREHYEVSEESEEELDDGVDRVQGTDSDSYEVDDDILSEFGVLQFLDPRELGTQVDGLVYRVFCRYIQAAQFEFQFFESRFCDLFDFVEEIQDILKGFIGDVGIFKLLLFGELGSESLKSLPYLDTVDEGENLFLGHVTIEALEGIHDLVLEIHFFLVLEDSCIFYRSFFESFCRRVFLFV